MIRLKNEVQYDWAMERIEELLPFVSDETPQDDPKFIELDVLSALVEEYEREHYNIDNLTLVNGEVVEKKRKEQMPKFIVGKIKVAKKGKPRKKVMSMAK